MLNAVTVQSKGALSDNNAADILLYENDIMWKIISQIAE